MRALVLLAAVACLSCSKSEAPSPPPATSATSSTQAEPAPTFDPKMPSFKCGAIRCNLDYYCVQRKQGEPSALCTSHPPGKHREGCMKVAERIYTCETFP